jgi:hypothetical protein
VLGEVRGDPPGDGVAGGGEQHPLRVGVPHPLPHRISHTLSLSHTHTRTHTTRQLNSARSWAAKAYTRSNLGWAWIQSAGPIIRQIFVIPSIRTSQRWSFAWFRKELSRPGG